MERHNVPEEFFKMALECELDFCVAKCVRESAQKAA